MGGLHDRSPRGEISAILEAHRRGERTAVRSLVPLLYDELRAVARRQLGRHRPSVVFDTTELVHETFLKLVDRGSVAVRDRGHFFALAACAMRQILVDSARRVQASKRGGGCDHLALEGVDFPAPMRAEEWLALDQALERLAEVNPRLVKVVECRFVAGLTDDETSEALGVNRRTVLRDWRRAQLWLRRILGPQEDGSGGGEER